MKLLRGSRALVTGASSGIGLAFAEAPAARGLHLMTLCPGGTATGFAAVAHAEAARRRGPVGSPASAVVADALKAFEAGKTYVVSTRDNWFAAVVLARLLPRRSILTIAGARFKAITGR